MSDETPYRQTNYETSSEQARDDLFEKMREAFLPRKDSDVPAFNNGLAAFVRLATPILRECSDEVVRAVGEDLIRRCYYLPRIAELEKSINRVRGEIKLNQRAPQPGGMGPPSPEIEAAAVLHWLSYRTILLTNDGQFKWLRPVGWTFQGVLAGLDPAHATDAILQPVVQRASGPALSIACGSIDIADRGVRSTDYWVQGLQQAERKHGERYLARRDFVVELYAKAFGLKLKDEGEAA